MCLVKPDEQTGVKGRLERYQAFPSTWITPRHVDVWVPPHYEDEPERRYPVLYMHDGQNLFFPDESFSGTAWGIDEALVRLARADRVDLPLVVGIWNTPERIPEYMPQKPLEAASSPRQMRRFVEKYGQAPCSDAYLRFIVEELKPFIDATYRTRSDRAHTHIMGSSMGGLISLYAMCEYPETFGGAACLSPSWTVAGRVMMRYLVQHTPDAHTHRLYFDYGVEAHIGAYETYQRKVDAHLSITGYRRKVNWLTRRFPGAEHTEKAWRARLGIPLGFLLAPHRENGRR